MSELFDRRATLTITAGTVRRTWDAVALHVAFDVGRTAGAEPNKAEITVYNFSEDSLRLASDRGASLVLSAGYKDTEGVLFAGDVDVVSSAREGGDLVTRLSCSDGGRALRSVVTSLSVARETSNSDLLDQLVDALGLSRGSIADLPGALKQGLAFAGPVVDQISALVSSQGYRWSVQDNQVQVHPPAGLPDNVVLLTPEKGLIDAPQPVLQQEQSAGATRRGVRCRSLLQPGLRPGRRIRVASRYLSGDFVVERVKHSGQSWATDWYTDVEAY